MLQRIRESFITKIIALLVMPGMLLAYFQPAHANGGPTDSNFSGGSDGQLVDMSSGSFNYNIPLLTVGGYPINLSYDADVTMDQQASMVGLGWNLNLGAIQRVVRGVPDDFDGDEIVTEMNLRPRLNITNILSVSSEIVGADLELSAGSAETEHLAGSISTDFGFVFNNYTGNENIIGIGGGIGIFEKTGDDVGPSAFLNGGISSSSRSGLSTNLGVSISLGYDHKFSSSLGINRNSLYGSSLNTGFGYSHVTKKERQEGYKPEHGRYKKSTQGINLTGSFPLGMQAYSPTATFEFENKSFTFDLGAGGTVVAGFDVHGNGSRTKSTVCLKSNVRSQKAYGYMNQQNGYDQNALQDFNLSLPSIYENTNALPTPMPTNDYFMVNGSGMFRALRNDAGYVKSPITRSEGDATAFSGDAAFGAGFEAGVNVTYNWNNTTISNWEGNNPFSDMGLFEFEQTTPSTDPVVKGKYEHFSFIQIGNGSSVSDVRFTGIEEKKALRQEITEEDGTIVGHHYMPTDEGENYHPASGLHYQNERLDRSQVMLHSTNQELRLRGDDSFENYTLNNFSFSAGDYTGVAIKSRNEANYRNNHIGQLTIINGGGSRDVYGIPVLNSSQQVSFNISEYNNYDPVENAPAVDAQGLVEYIPGADNSLGNKRGDNHFYLNNHLPQHATSYLLTQQLSDNYVDRTGNGPTPDDYGSYTKFNYAYNGEKKWRFPYHHNKAIFNEGFKSNKLDDMANYAYGERDEWYVHSIESKDYIAEFVYSNRKDAHGVQDENGGVDASAKAKKLDQIKLYTRKGKEYGEGPIKTVHFNYSYELCKNIPDHIGFSETSETGPGKLTLESVYFKGQDSPQGELHKYKFTYGANADYALGQLDRWGNYQAGAAIDHDHTSSLDNAEYPYTTQNKSQADLNIQQWKLTAVDLPTGGRLEVDYEANDYEYIQDKEATRMYKIGGFYSTDVEPESFTPTAGDFGSALFDPDNDDIDNFYIKINLDVPITGNPTSARNQFEEHFLPERRFPEDRYLYFNTLLNLAPHNDGIVDPDVYEYIQGYASIIENSWYLLESSPGVWNAAVFRLKPAWLKSHTKPDPKGHPIWRKACQVVKQALPLVLYPENDLQAIYAKDGSINCGSSETEDGGTEPDMGDDSKNHKKNLKSIRSVYHMMRKTGYASRAVLPKCWVRMRSGLQSKVGGGYRVKEIRTYDNWNAFVAGESGAKYGTRYEYQTTNLAGDTISSGVTSYEPTNRGGDEIALRHPHFYVHEQKGTPSESFYTEFPLNEEIFASAQVRYSKVTSRPLDYSEHGLEVNTPGYTVYESYTARDYPLQFDYTNFKDELKPPGLAGFFGFNTSRFGVSFGAAVIANDMHGKFKQKRSFTADGNTIYLMKHEYWEAEDGTLTSKVPTINPGGTHQNRLIGMNIDLITHLSKTESNSSRVSGKTNFEFTPPFLFVPSFWPGFNDSESSVYSTLTTKVVYQSGLLKQVMVEDNGRAKYTTTLLYDAKTGNPIAKEVIPEKGDEDGIQKMYEYTYPAYWAYEGMGMASDNSGITRFDITGAGTTVLPGEKPFFYPGDELAIIEFDDSGILPVPLGGLPNHWVVENEITGAWFLADANGNVFNPNPSRLYWFKVQNPGKANLAGVGMASVSTLGTYAGDNLYTAGFTGHTHVINTSGTDFFEKAKLRTDPCTEEGDVINPYAHNLLGQWKQEHSYVFDGDRDYSADDSRKDGLLTEHQPFWKNEAGTWRAIYDPARTSDYDASDPLQDWIQTGSATLYDSYGFGLESKNAIDIYQSQGIGYNKRLQKSATANARYAESGFDGFEDYFSDGVYDGGSFTPYGCHTRHFGVPNGHNLVTDQEAHSGRYSVRAHGPYGVQFIYSTWDGTEPTATDHGQPFMVQEADIIPQLQLMTDQPENRYVLTVWAKKSSNGLLVTNPTSYTEAQVDISIAGMTDLVETRSNIIDGWQRIEITFNLPPSIPNNTLVQIRLRSMDGDVFYDDLRLQPYDSEMQSAAIDAIERRNMASLGSRDFATSYQYDENGRMVRVFQETERGVQTVQESRSGIKTNY